MAQKVEEIYQFKITLKYSNPPIWRRIQVPDSYTFWDLHGAIQDAMGWLDCHLHEFVVLDPETPRPVHIGVPDETTEDKVLSGREEKLSSYFSLKNNKAHYDYDFGDNWEHTVVLEKILPAVHETTYPLCIGGNRECPPEDCGGVRGYEHLLEVLKDPTHEEYEDLLEWVGEPFDLEAFSPEDVVFTNPEERLKNNIL
tara:strand:+ start:1617 stop:2210 length:594 start_codon:yes stop_codon:yes gene_type:complete